MESFLNDDDTQDNTYEHKKKWVKQINTLCDLANIDSHYDLDIRYRIGVLFGYAYHTKQFPLAMLPKEILVMILNIAYPPVSVKILKTYALSLNIYYMMKSMEGIRYTT